MITCIFMLYNVYNNCIFEAIAYSIYEELNE